MRIGNRRQFDDEIVSFAVLPFQVHRRSDTLQFTRGNDRQTIAEQIRFVQMVSRENDRSTRFVFENQIPNGTTSVRIDT